MNNNWKLETLPEAEILRLCKESINGDWEAYSEVIKNSEHFGRSTYQEYLIKIEEYVELLVKKNLNEILQNDVYCDDDSTEFLFWAMRKKYGKTLATYEEYLKLLKELEIKPSQDSVIDFDCAKGGVVTSCLCFALFNGLGFAKTIKKLNYSFFGYKQNKIFYFEDYITIMELAKNFMVFLSPNDIHLEGSDEQYQRWFATAMQVDFVFLRSCYEEVYDVDRDIIRKMIQNGENNLSLAEKEIFNKK